MQQHNAAEEDEGNKNAKTNTTNNKNSKNRNRRQTIVSIEKNMYSTNNNNKGGMKNSHSYNELNMITSDMETVNTGMDTRIVDNSRKALNSNKKKNSTKNEEFDTIPTMISAEGGGSRHTFTMSKSNKIETLTEQQTPIVSNNNGGGIRRTFDLGKSNKGNLGLLGSSDTPPPSTSTQKMKRRSSLGVSGNVYRQVMEKSPANSRGYSVGRRSTLAGEQAKPFYSYTNGQGGSSSGGGAKRRSSMGISENAFRAAMERHSSTAAVYGGDKQQSGKKKKFKKKKSDEGGWKDMKSMSVQELIAELKIIHGINIDGRYEKADLMGACAQARRTHKSGGIGIQAAMRSSSTQQKKSMKRAKSLDGSNDQSELGGGGKPAKQHEMKRGKSLDSSNQAAAAAYLSDNSGHSRPSLFNQRRRRRKTNDTNASNNNFNNSGASGLDYSANPQQGFHLVETNLGDGPRKSLPPGMGGPRRRTTQASFRSRSMDRRHSKDMSCGSSISSSALGLDIDNNNNNMDGAVLNVPLGVGLSSAARDGQNPNKQMALLLQQMQVLEEQQVTRGQLNKSQQQQQKQQQRRRTRSRSRRRTGDSSYHNSEYNKSGASTPGSSWYGGSQHDVDAYMSGASSYGGGGMDRSNRSYKSAATDMKEYLMTSGTTASQHNSSYNGNRRPTYASSGGGSIRDLCNASDANLKFDDEDGVTFQMRKPTSDNVTSSDPTGTTKKKRSGRAWRKKKRPSKKNICIGLVCFLIVGGGLAAGLWFGLYHEGNLFGNNGSVATTSAPDRTGNNSTSTQKYLVDPPLDIEGRCSPSNLPGSMQSCYEACLPAACCYPINIGVRRV